MDTIPDVYGRFAHALDQGDGVGFGDCFTEDALYTIDGSGTIRGRAALAAGFPQSRAAPVKHLIGSIVVIEESASFARSAAGLIAINRDGTVAVCGTYHDEVSLELDGRWRFSSKHLSFEYRSEGFTAMMARLRPTSPG